MKKPAPPPEPLPVPVADNHAHLDMSRDESPARPVPEVLAEAAAVGVDRVVQIGVDVAAARYTAELVRDQPGLVGGVAIHPNEAPRLAARGALAEALAEIEDIARQPKIRVIGETGLDYFRTPEPGRPAQHESFRAHIELAKRLGLTMQIHDREAHTDVLAILDEQGAPERTVMHCFSGDADFAHECVRRGLYLSFAGPLTYPSAESLRQALMVTPLERVLVETDAPFLAPAPHRGRNNAPSLIPFTVRTIATVLDRPLEQVCATISATSDDLYGPW